MTSFLKLQIFLIIMNYFLKFQITFSVISGPCSVVISPFGLCYSVANLQLTVCEQINSFTMVVIFEIISVVDA